eukprot:gene3193-3999_t
MNGFITTFDNKTVMLMLTEARGRNLVDSLYLYDIDQNTFTEYYVFKSRANKDNLIQQYAYDPIKNFIAVPGAINSNPVSNVIIFFWDLNQQKIKQIDLGYQIDFIYGKLPVGAYDSTTGNYYIVYCSLDHDSGLHLQFPYVIYSKETDQIYLLDSEFYGPNYLLYSVDIQQQTYKNIIKVPCNFGEAYPVLPYAQNENTVVFISSTHLGTLTFTTMDLNTMSTTSSVNFSNSQPTEIHDTLYLYGSAGDIIIVNTTSGKYYTNYDPLDQNLYLLEGFVSGSRIDKTAIVMIYQYVEKYDALFNYNVETNEYQLYYKFKNSMLGKWNLGGNFAYDPILNITATVLIPNVFIWDINNGQEINLEINSLPIPYEYQIPGYCYDKINGNYYFSYQTIKNGPTHVYIYNLKSRSLVGGPYLFQNGQLFTEYSGMICNNGELYILNFDSDDDNLKPMILNSVNLQDLSFKPVLKIPARYQLNVSPFIQNQNTVLFISSLDVQNLTLTTLNLNTMSTFEITIDNILPSMIGFFTGLF